MDQTTSCSFTQKAVSIDDRRNEWAESYGVYVDAQYGFPQQRPVTLRESIPRLLNEGTTAYDRRLCPGLQPGPPSQTQGDLGQRY